VRVLGSIDALRPARKRCAEGGCGTKDGRDVEVGRTTQNGRRLVGGRGIAVWRDIPLGWGDKLNDRVPAGGCGTSKRGVGELCGVSASVRQLCSDTEAHQSLSAKNQMRE